MFPVVQISNVLTAAKLVWAVFANFFVDRFQNKISKFNFFLIYLFVSRHEVHSMNTHTLQNAGWYKQTKQNVVQGIEAGGITGLQTLFATALKTEP